MCQGIGTVLGSMARAAIEYAETDSARGGKMQCILANLRERRSTRLPIHIPFHPRTQ